MQKEKIKSLYFDKISKLNTYNKAYYDQDNPIVQDSEYDILVKEILDLENKYKFLKNKFSPLDRVGYEPSDKFGKIVIQDLGGRMMPINTYASELLRKLSKSNHYKDLDANQAILSMYESPLLWYNIPIIYLKKNLKDLSFDFFVA